MVSVGVSAQTIVIRFIDSCLASTSPGTSFSGSANLSSYNADLMQWNGTGWTGSWPGAQLTLAPPTGSNTCRAIFTGNSTDWTTGGEYFAVQMTQALVAGQLYSLTLTYVAHGLASNNSFAPFLYSGNNGMNPVYSIMQMPAANSAWVTNTVTFTAVAAQAGHTWLHLGTVPNGNSGMMLGFCETCLVSQPTNTLQGSITAVPSCSGTCNATATANATNGYPPYTYLWLPGNSTSPAITNVCPGANYSVTIRDSLGFTVLDSITIPAITPPTVTISATDTTFCAGEQTQICATGNYPVYNWSSMGTAGNCITATQAGSYQVTVSDNNQCTAQSNTATITTYPAPQATVTATKYNMCASDSSLVCVNQSFDSYLWNTGETGNCIYARLAGNYYLTVTDQNSCTALSSPAAINVYPQPPVSISANGNVLTVYNTTNCQWYLNSNPISGATDSVYVADVSGYYTVSVTDSNGCTAFSNSIFVNSIGIEELTGNVLLVYPNPANGSVTIAIDKHLIGITLSVIDVTGRTVATVQLQTLNSKLETSLLANGVYFVAVGNLIQKLIIQK